MAQPVYLTKLKPLGGSSFANSTFRSSVPPLVPLRTPSTATSFRADRSVLNPRKGAVPAALPISLYTGGGLNNSKFLSASMRKQDTGINNNNNAFKGINTVEKISRGQQMLNMARSKSPSCSYANMSSIFEAKHQKEDKSQYLDLLHRVCPDLYSKKKSKE